MRVPVSQTTLLSRHQSSADDIRSIPELSGGWGNPRMRDETAFLILDSAYANQLSSVTSDTNMIQHGRLVGRTHDGWLSQILCYSLRSLVPRPNVFLQQQSTFAWIFSWYRGQVCRLQPASRLPAPARLVLRRNMSFWLIVDTRILSAVDQDHGTIRSQGDLSSNGPGVRLVRNQYRVFGILVSGNLLWLVGEVQQYNGT
jgi:hypothetical protein